MSIKSLIFIGLFFICSAGALFFPYLGVYGYVANYCIGAADQWWEAPFSGLGIRYAQVLAFTTFLGVIFQQSKQRFGEKFLMRQEFVLLIFLGVIWFSAFWGSETIGRYTTVDHPSVKFSKVMIFIFLMTHIITDRQKLDGLFWVLVLSALILGLQAYDTPRRAFQSGRLEGIGGPDFAESNFLAAFMASMLPIIGIQLLRCKKWWGKIICIISAAFTANTIVLCRSRGAFIGIASGILVATIFSPKKYRFKLFLGLLLGIAGGLYVSDPQFIERSMNMFSSEKKLDTSAANRIEYWKAGVQMVYDHPLGIGIGNWLQTVNKYLPPDIKGLDSHSTFVKCFAELGIHGLIVFGVLIFGAFSQLLRVRKCDTVSTPVRDELQLFSFALIVSLAIMFTCGLTITMIYTEFLWFFLCLPTCLERTMQNIKTDQSISDLHERNNRIDIYSNKRPIK